MDNYNWVDAPTTGALSLDLKNMEPDHTYYVRVRAILDSFESGYASAHIGISGNILPATPATGVTAYTRYRQLTGQAIYDVIVNWLPSSLTGRVYYKTSYASAENVIGTTRTPWGAWVFAGEGAGQLVIPQLLPGETIRVAVTTANELGEYTVPDAVEYLDVVVAEQTTKPLAPENLSIEFTDKVVVKWNAVTNTTIAYYEVRTNNAPGEAAGLLVQTTDLQAALPLTERQGTIFVLAKNTQGEYSSASELTYKKEAPKAPKAPNVKTGIGTLTITAQSFPVGVSKMHVRIIGQQHSAAFDTTSSVVSYACESDIYDVSISFIDVFGPGAESGVTTVTVTATVDLSTLNRETLGLDEIDKNIAKIEAEVGTVKSDVTGLQTKLTQTAEGLQQSVTDLKTNVQTQLSQFSNSIDLRVSNAIKGLDGDGLISRINLSTSGVRIDGKLIHVTGQALFDDNIITNKMLKAGSVSADKMQVESLDTISARIGTLRTATSGARTEIKDNLIEVYDDDNELRVRIGIWD